MPYAVTPEVIFAMGGDETHTPRSTRQRLTSLVRSLPEVTGTVDATEHRLRETQGLALYRMAAGDCAGRRAGGQ